MRSTYKSIFLEGAPTLATGFSRAYLRFVSIIMIPIMIVTLFAALQESNILPYLYKGFPAGLMLAAFASVYWMRATAAVIEIRDERVRVLTVREAYAELDVGWAYIIDIATPQTDRATITVGLDTYTLVSSQWPDYQQLIQHLAKAHEAYKSL